MRGVSLRTFAGLLPWLVVGVSGCQPQESGVVAIEDIAEAYVKLVLAVGQHDDGYVDAYYGPPEWRAAVEERDSSLEELAAEALALHAALSRAAVDESDSLARLRHDYLAKQLEAAAARIRMLQGAVFSFDAETRALYDAQAPVHSEQQFEAILEEIDALIPGENSLAERVIEFRERFVIPPQKLQAVFDAAIEECRRRTLEHLQLPAGERFTVEYVKDKPWSGYNWYQGDGYSLIQVNTDLPIFIDRAVDLGCHEGYPGHHTYNVLLEHHLVQERGWSEFSVYPLFSPQSLIAEGTANYGIDIAFPGEERLKFERDVLFPLAGLDATAAGTYHRLGQLLEKLSYADNEAARRYLDGQLTREETVEWLMRYRLSARDRAEQRVRFIETYRGYVINYNLGQDLVRGYIERLAGQEPARRWAEFGVLISSPRLPSGLR